MCDKVYLYKNALQHTSDQIEFFNLSTSCRNVDVCALHLVDTNFLNMSARQKMDLSECVYAFLTHRADKKYGLE